MKKLAVLALGVVLAASAAGAAGGPSVTPAKGVRISKKAAQSLRERERKVAALRKAGQEKRQQALSGN